MPELISGDSSGFSPVLLFVSMKTWVMEISNYVPHWEAWSTSPQTNNPFRPYWSVVKAFFEINNKFILLTCDNKMLLYAKVME
ncbi:hypothetical protein U0026_05230 [Kluyvera intermedia]|uniref:hypothetical protein n=1 Tax=Kluyvera intermedia TaxID=61648 RepID=UPI000F838C5E|nr:hypothetical protein [Kluyvera intermedia]WQD30689.1 hypothetical protein U0026_05230 [Kluyvera intermedia]